MRGATRFTAVFAVSPDGTTVANVPITMMKLFTGSAVALFALSSVVGCSSPDKGVATSSSAALAEIQNPTGTFDKSNGSQAFAGYNQNKQSSSSVAGASGGATAGGTTAQSIKFLANQTGNCAQGSSCACPGGGSFQYAAKRTNDSVELSLDMSACVFESGDSFDGNALFVQSQKALVDDSKLPQKSAPYDDGLSNLLAMEGDATVLGKTSHVKLVYLEQHGWVYLSVEVPSGSLVVGVASDGTAVVKAKDKTWTCDYSSHGYSCKSDAGDDAVDVEASSSSSSATASSSSADTSDDSSEADRGSKF